MISGGYLYIQGAQYAFLVVHMSVKLLRSDGERKKEGRTLPFG